MSPMNPPEALRCLGALLDRSEAAWLAAALEDGDPLTSAVGVVTQEKQASVIELADVAALRRRPEILASVLRGIEGAHSTAREVTAIWTTPSAISSGGVTTSLVSLVNQARRSVVCSTYNFQESSGMWQALRTASSRPGVGVSVYLDREVGTVGGSAPLGDVAAQIAPGVVYATKAIKGRPVRNHAKFLVIDSRWLVVTSANFSWSAENRNIELGVQIDDVRLARQVEDELAEMRGTLYTQVDPAH